MGTGSGCWRVLNVQCLSGPLLRVPDRSRKAERITLKDFSQRDVTSSGVIPFVSIFGRIFTLMVPAQQQTGIVASPTATAVDFKESEVT